MYNLKEIFPAKLRQILDETNTSQTDLAKHTKLSPNTIAKYLDGRRFPMVDCLLRIAIFFDKRIEWFLIEEKEEKEPNRVVACEKPFKTLSENLTYEEMCEILKGLMTSGKPNIREWTIVQFEKAFGDYCPTTDKKSSPIYNIDKKEKTNNSTE